MDNLAEVRERTRAEIEAALERTRLELAGVERRRLELRGEIERAEAWLGLEPDPEPDEGGEGGMTLHGAMEEVLREWGSGRVTKLAAEIEARGLYRRKDGKPAGPHQVHARIHNYPEKFERSERGVVKLKHR